MVVVGSLWVQPRYMSYDDASLEGKDDFSSYVISSSLNSLGIGMAEENQFSQMVLCGIMMLAGG